MFPLSPWLSVSPNEWTETAVDFALRGILTEKRICPSSWLRAKLDTERWRSWCTYSVPAAAPSCPCWCHPYSWICHWPRVWDITWAWSHSSQLCLRFLICKTGITLRSLKEENVANVSVNTKLDFNTLPRSPWETKLVTDFDLHG